LVLDVKTGSAAFLPELSDTLRLAETMVDIGNRHGTPTVALVTAMDRPLGRAVGNALEVREAVDCLRGRGPSDLEDLVVALVAEMLVLGGLEPDRARAERCGRETLASGAALERFRRLVVAQGGDPASLDRPQGLPRAAVRVEVRADVEGVVAEVAPRPLGQAVVEMGGGRKALGDPIDPAVGFLVEVRPGDRVAVGDLLGEVHAADDRSAEDAARALRGALRVGPSERPTPLPLISHRVTGDGVEVLTAPDA
jgi:pyrimidine-nucleoside phosphorylase